MEKSDRTLVSEACHTRDHETIQRLEQKLFAMREMMRSMGVSLVEEAEAMTNGHAHEQMLKTLKLTEREHEVIMGILKGQKIREVAETLYMSESTVKTHMSHVYEKLQVHSRTELITKLMLMGAGA